MTAAYRLKGIGWFAVLVGVVLGFYLVSLRVATERKKLDDMNARIAAAQRDIRALETEFDTRANLVQLERWNGDTLALVSPSAAQFVSDDAALASLDPHAASGLPGTEVKVAALVVPSLPQTPVASGGAVAMPAVVVAAPARRPMDLLPAGFTRAAAPAVGGGRPASILPAGLFRAAAAEPVAPSGRNAPALARAAEAARGALAVAKVRPQAVAMLDRKLLSDTTFGDIMSGARRESRR